MAGTQVLNHKVEMAIKDQMETVIITMQLIAMPQEEKVETVGMVGRSV